MLKNSQIIKTETEWLEARKACITATEVAALFGLNPYSSPRKILEEKAKSTFIPNAYTITGQWLEDVVCKASNLALGAKFQIPLDGGSLEGKVFCRHPKLALGATPDAWSITSEGTDLLECKSTRPETFIKYLKEPPKNYLLQLATQMMCAETQGGYLAILMTDLTQTCPTLVNPIVIYDVARIPAIETLISQEVTRFWGCVSKGTEFKVNSKIKAEMIDKLSTAVDKVYAISDQALELYFKNRVNIYSGIVDKYYSDGKKSELEIMLDEEVLDG